MTQITYPNKLAVGYTYDKLDRVTTMRDVRGNDTKIQYDKVGNVTSMIDPGNQVYKYTYDKKGNMTKEIDPLAASTGIVTIKTTKLSASKTQQTQ